MTGADENYDPRAIQDKWQARWAELEAFAARARDPAASGPRTRWTCSRTRPATCTWATPRRSRSATSSPATGSSSGYNVLHPIGWDSFGLPAENAAIKRNSHPAEWTYANIETQAESFRRYAISFDWSPAAAHLRPGVLPLDPVAVPALLRARPGLPQGRPGQLVPATTRPCWPTSRSSPATASAAAPRSTKRELTQWYFKITEYADRLLDDMDAAGGQLARPRAADAAQLDRPVRGRRRRLRRSRAATSRSPSSPPGPTRCTARRSSWSPPTPRWPRRSARPSSGPRSRRTATRCHARPRSSGCPTEREKTGVFLGRYAVNPVNGERIPVWAADYVLADYGTGAIMAVPGARPARPGLRAEVRPARPRRRRHRRRPTRPRPASPPPATARLVNSGPLDGLSKADAIAADHRDPGGARAGARRRSTTGCATGWCPGSGSGAAPIPIIHCRVVRRGPGPGRPAAGDAAGRPARRRPGAQGRLAAGRRHRLGQRRLPEVRRRRPSATPTRWTPSSTRPGTSCATARPDYDRRPVRRRAVAPVDAGRPVHRRRRARDPAPAVQPVLHQGAARHGHGRLRRAVHRGC